MRLQSIQALRGISALLVVGVHVLDTHNPGPVPPLIRSVASYGFHGVTMFFVISGFVLPLALSKTQYRLADFPRFMLKRIARLEPPYLVSLLFAIALLAAASVSPGYKGVPFHIDALTIASHVGYVAPLVDRPWIVGVYWTLLIEAQFYLLIGLTFPLFKRTPMLWLFALLCTTAIPASWNALSFHLAPFVVGMCAFAWRARWIGTSAALAVIATASASLLTFRDIAFIPFALFAAGYILWAAPKSRLLLFLGSISYSLYLVHLPISKKVINLLLRFLPGGLGASAAALTACALSIGAAWVLWRFIERPSMSLAERVRYSDR